MKKTLVSVLIIFFCASPLRGAPESSVVIQGSKLPQFVREAIDLLKKETDVKLTYDEVVMILNLKKWAPPQILEEVRTKNSFVIYNQDGKWPHLPIYLNGEKELWKILDILDRDPREHNTIVSIVAALLAHERGWHSQGHQDELGALEIEQVFLSYLRTQGLFVGNYADKYYQDLLEEMSREKAKSLAASK